MNSKRSRINDLRRDTRAVAGDPNRHFLHRNQTDPQVQMNAPRPDVPENRRLGEALFPRQGDEPPPPEGVQQLEVDAALTFNDREHLQKADFETMTADEWRAAKRLLAQLNL
ncbi:MAG TPA: hypothetical protein PLL72_10775, partial [Burkholderiaceae bacterium]|nr:hypothetical protein [Burkholderiaceae bacterium]